MEHASSTPPGHPGGAPAGAPAPAPAAPPGAAGTRRRTPARTPIGTHAFNVVRGGLIGTAEVVPGISGGTVALIVGVYESIITSAGHVVSGIRHTVTDGIRGRGMGAAAAEFRRADWGTVAAVAIGMVAAAIVAARVVAPLVEAHPEHSYGLFFGLVLASLWVPYTAAGARWRPWHYAVALAAAVAAFFATGMPPAQVEPTPIVVAAAAAIAVSALVMPGMSGSFILLTLGLYTTTMAALNERDLGYIGTFLLGAAIGGALFVKLLQWLLEHHRMITLVVMTGVMAGSLRALWPWQDADRGLSGPSADAGTTVLFAAGGFCAVVVVLLLEHAVSRRRAPHVPDWDADGDSGAPGSAAPGRGGGRHTRPASRR